MDAEEKLIRGLKLVVEAFAEMINANISQQSQCSSNQALTEFKEQTFALKEAAEYAGLSEWSIRQAAIEGRLEHIMVGNKRLFRRSAIDRWLRQQEENSVKKETTESNYGKLRKVKE